MRSELLAKLILAAITPMNMALWEVQRKLRRYLTLLREITRNGGRTAGKNVIAAHECDFSLHYRCKNNTHTPIFLSRANET